MARLVAWLNEFRQQKYTTQPITHLKIPLKKPHLEKQGFIHLTLKTKTRGWKIKPPNHVRPPKDKHPTPKYLISSPHPKIHHTISSKQTTQQQNKTPSTIPVKGDITEVGVAAGSGDWDFLTCPRCVLRFGFWFWFVSCSCFFACLGFSICRNGGFYGCAVHIGQKRLGNYPGDCRYLRFWRGFLTL